jgi:hypothetical protein
MYIVRPKLLTRQLVHKEGKSTRVSRLAPPVEYKRANGTGRIKILHPTKGWRDRNIDSISQAMTGFRANEFSLRAK